MANYFLHTSALIKRYLGETGTFWVRNLFATRTRLIIARITHAELASTLARRVRESTLSPDDEVRLLQLFLFSFEQAVSCC